MSKKLKYTLLLGGVAVLVMMPVLLRLIPEPTPSARRTLTPSEVAVYFGNSQTQFLSYEVRTLDEHLPHVDHVWDMLTQAVSWLQTPTAPQHDSLLNYVAINHMAWRMLYVPNATEPSIAVSFDFSTGYRGLSTAEQLLVRTGVVQTFLGLPMVDEVSFTIGDMPLRNNVGQLVAPFTRESLMVLPDVGAHIFARTNQWVSLYFVRDDLQGLYQELAWIDMNQDISLEETVLRELLLRGLGVDNRLFFPSDLSLIEISTIDNVAYIDFNARFDTAPEQGRRAQMLSIYAIVNTLTGLGTGVEAVEFFVENERPIEFVGLVDLSQSFTRNEGVLIGQ